MHFMKKSHLEKPCGSCNPYPSAFYEGELPGKGFKELKTLILVHFMKENYLEKPCRS